MAFAEVHTARAVTRLKPTICRVDFPSEDPKTGSLGLSRAVTWLKPTIRRMEFPSGAFLLFPGVEGVSNSTERASIRENDLSKEMQWKQPEKWVEWKINCVHTVTARRSVLAHASLCAHTRLHLHPLPMHQPLSPIRCSLLLSLPPFLCPSARSSSLPLLSPWPSVPWPFAHPPAHLPNSHIVHWCQKWQMDPHQTCSLPGPLRVTCRALWFPRFEWTLISFWEIVRNSLRYIWR